MGEKVLLTDAFKQLYGQLDPIAEEHAKKMGATCRRGCHHCCQLLALITPTEAINIALSILQSREWIVKLPEMLPRLRVAAIAGDFKEVTKTKYFDKRIMCPFIENGECSIYSIRPAACRYHYVLSPPENCSPDAPRDIEIPSIDLVHFEAHVWKLDDEFMKRQYPVCAPIPITVLWALKKVIDDADQNSEFVKVTKPLIDEAAEGVTNPMKWTMDNFESLIADATDAKSVSAAKFLDEKYENLTSKSR